MQLALSKDTIDLLGELLEKEQDEMDAVDPNEEGCLLDQDEYAKRMAALDELQDLTAKCRTEEAG